MKVTLRKAKATAIRISFARLARRREIGHMRLVLKIRNNPRCLPDTVRE